MRTSRPFRELREIPISSCSILPAPVPIPNSTTVRARGSAGPTAVVGGTAALIANLVAGCVSGAGVVGTVTAKGIDVDVLASAGWTASAAGNIDVGVADAMIVATAAGG